jgi:putative redox protein
MADTRPPTHLELVWDGRLMFTARESGHEWVLDGRNEAGPSPVAALASALAGCIAIDIVHILTKGRFVVRAFRADLVGRRADSEPRRFVSMDLRLTIDTDAPREQIERAIALSRDKYCSVWHSLRQDIELTTSVSLAGSDPTLTPIRNRGVRSDSDPNSGGM